MGEHVRRRREELTLTQREAARAVGVALATLKNWEKGRAKVGEAYGARVTTTPHKYVTGGHYLTVRALSPVDSALRMVFESEAGRIVRYRSGHVPEVEFVERCG